MTDPSRRDGLGAVRQPTAREADAAARLVHRIARDPRDEADPLDPPGLTTTATQED